LTAKPLASASGVPAEAQRQQTAAEAVATAQTLWNAGSREPAIRLLNDVLLSAERSLANNANVPLGAGVSALVRELTRMQLADGRPGAAWDVLVRLEPHLRNEADLWAVRGNAAQRLGRHTDSVLAYMAALQLRPAEQRWMLGAAVSLAAAGKTEDAASMVEKARAAGPISTEVQAYLRQMGVPLSD
jgi:Flp pilus assembly protein TadD